MNNRLVRPDTGVLIPYDATGASSTTQAGWYFCSNDTYTTRVTTTTQFVRVNGPAAVVKAQLQWLYEWNMLPTDLYYASFDGVDYDTDVSVGRVPVSSEAQADAFVSKVIAYEQRRKPDGTALDAQQLEKMLIVSSNWDRPIQVFSTPTNPPEDEHYCHLLDKPYSLVKLKEIPVDLKRRLLAQVTATDVRILSYNRNASASSHGWFCGGGPSSVD